MEKYIWIVYEENHGAVSYFDSVEKAIDEMTKIANYTYVDPIKQISQEEDYITVLLEGNYEMVFAKKVKLNESWAD